MTANQLEPTPIYLLDILVDFVSQGDSKRSSFGYVKVVDLARGIRGELLVGGTLVREVRHGLEELVVLAPVSAMRRLWIWCCLCIRPSHLHTPIHVRVHNSGVLSRVLDTAWNNTPIRFSSAA